MGWNALCRLYRRDEQIEEKRTATAATFVRGQKGHESFSFLAAKEQAKVHLRMRELGKKHNFTGDKGQGAGFMTLACLQRRETSFIREGGKLAVILPATAAVGMGNAWSGVREKIERDFDLETVIVSREKNRPNFSENTALQECILIARRRIKEKEGEKKQPRKKAMFIVLQKNPETVGDAHATAKAISRAKENGKELGDLYYSDSPLRGVMSEPIGQYALLPWHKKSAWRGISFTNLQLAFAAESFSQKGTLLPYAKGKASLHQLDKLATFGGATLHLKLNHKNFHLVNIVNHKTQYAGYYPGYHKTKKGIAHKDESGIAEKPHCYLMPVNKKHQQAEDFFAKAGRIVLNESFRFNTARRLAVLVSEPVQASHYWPVKLNNENEDKLKTLTLWLNSTPALLLIVNSAQSTHGAKVGFSQKAAMELIGAEDLLITGNNSAQSAIGGVEIAKVNCERLPKCLTISPKAPVCCHCRKWQMTTNAPK